jgi:hypothetical protein
MASQVRRRRRGRLPPPPPPTQPTPPLPLFHRILKSWWARAIAVVAFFGGITAVFPIHDVYRQTYPEIQITNRDALDPPSTVVFDIKNIGAYFTMRGISIACSLNRPYIQRDLEHHGTRYVIGDVLSLHEELPPGGHFIYKCDPHILVRGIERQGSMPNRLNIRVYVSMAYKLHTWLYNWQRHHRSSVFSCELTADQSNCREGDILPFVWYPGVESPSAPR